MWPLPESSLDPASRPRRRWRIDARREALERLVDFIQATVLVARLAPRMLVSRCTELDLRWAIALHRMAARPGALMLLVAASRLGDGVLWVAIALAIPLLGGPQGVPCAIQLVVVGATNLALYALLKRRVGRPRPFVACPDIRACARALDRYSFPSGHTLHAVASATLLSFHYPLFAIPLWIFAGLVMASRIVLGLHYPSDVAVGAVIGASTALVALAVHP
jgi:undecaprenyl-diphosphatase